MKNQQGYTLVELLIALAITSIMVITVGMVVRETVTVPEQGNEQVRALHAIQNAAHWVSVDGQAAKAASGGSGLILTKPDDSTVRYILDGDELRRIDSDSNQVISRGIYSVSFTVDGRLITVNITAEPDSRWNTSESGTFQIYMRPTPQG
jgi:prepilin-type N-terminal cleavage/methylation domain-containing protein